MTDGKQTNAKVAMKARLAVGGVVQIPIEPVVEPQEGAALIAPLAAEGGASYHDGKPPRPEIIADLQAKMKRHRTSAGGIAHPDPEKILSAVNLSELRMPMARFPGLKRAIPDFVTEVVGPRGVMALVAPIPTPVVTDKSRVPYFIAGELREAPLVGKTLEFEQKYGRPTVGIQRSKSHIVRLGPAFFGDVDGYPVFDLVPRIEALGLCGIIYPSYSHGMVKEGATSPALGGRAVLLGDRPWSVEEHWFVWAAVNELLKDVLDYATRGPAHCYGGMAARAPGMTLQPRIVEGAAFDVNVMVARGKELQPPGSTSSGAADDFTQRLDKQAVLDRVKLLGEARPPVEYDVWVKGAPAFRRWQPDDRELAFKCFDTWSAAAGDVYPGTETCRTKFDSFKVSDDDEHGATVDGLSWAARRRSVAVLEAARGKALVVVELVEPDWVTSLRAAPPSNKFAIASAVHDDLSAGIRAPRPAEKVGAAYATPERVVTAIRFLVEWWPPAVLDALVAKGTVLQADVDTIRTKHVEAQFKRRLGARKPLQWSGHSLPSDTETFAEQLVEAADRLYARDGQVVELHLGRQGERPATRPITSSAHRRDVVNRHLARVRRSEDGKLTLHNIEFRPGVSTGVEPDAQVLQNLFEQVLPHKARGLRGIVTAPTFDRVPATREGRIEGAVQLIDKPGYDAGTGLFLHPLGTSIIDVPRAPTQADEDAALTLIRDELLGSFAFATDGDMARAVFAIVVAAVRQSLDLVPGFAFRAGSQGVGAGKSTLAGVLAIVATGTKVAPANLAGDFSEQEKRIFGCLLSGVGALYIDNVSSGARVDSSTLATIITRPTFTSRTMYTHDMRAVSTRVIVTLNGNALSIDGELGDKIVLTNLKKQRDLTKHRPSLENWVVDNQASIVRAALVLILRYIDDVQAGGIPAVVTQSKATPTRYGPALDTVRYAVIRALKSVGGDPLSDGFDAARDTSSSYDEAQGVLSVIVGALDRLGATSFSNGRTVSEILKEIAEPDERHTILEWLRIYDPFAQIPRNKFSKQLRARLSEVDTADGRVLQVGKNAAKSIVWWVE